jgi:hypothetical protein
MNFRSIEQIQHRGTFISKVWIGALAFCDSVGLITREAYPRP